MDAEIKYRLAKDEDIDSINAFYNSVYKSDRSRAKFNWEFNSSPAGRAVYVIAEFKSQIIGTQCVIPYYVITQKNETILSGKSEDTLVSPDHRGKNIFENMYKLLISECQLRKIEFIWGFTYATKPFLKLGFKIPFSSRIGIYVNSPFKAAHYLSSLSAKNKFIDRFKIIGLSIASRFKSFRILSAESMNFDVGFKTEELNNEQFNYLNDPGSFGLKLDPSFLNYRITNNLYSSNYKTLNYKKDGVLMISMVYTISKQGVGYIIHLHVSKKLSDSELRKTITAAFKTTELKNCILLRFWGFSHTQQNLKEIELLETCGFTFINRGISFVWLKLNEENGLQPEHFVLSRMASQGTD